MYLQPFKLAFHWTIYSAVPITNASHCIFCVLEGSVCSTHHEHVMFDKTTLMGSISFRMARQTLRELKMQNLCHVYSISCRLIAISYPSRCTVFVSEPWSVSFLRCSKRHSFQHHRQHSDSSVLFQGFHWVDVYAVCLLLDKASALVHIMKKKKKPWSVNLPGDLREF